jgi:hypothetical protein
MSMCRGLGVLCVLLVGPLHVRGQETARAVIERAVQVHGGLKQLSQIRADHIQAKGTVVIEGKEMPFVCETLVQLPSQFKNVMHVTTPKGRVTMVEILNGDKVLVTIDGQPQKVDASAQAELRETFQLNRAIRLVPLLTDRSYELTALGPAMVNDRPALGVRVAARGRRELRMFFDKETGLLAKTETTLDAGEGKEVRQEVYFGDFRDLGGYKRPAKLAAFRDGKKVMELELTDVKYLEKIDESEFAKP